MTRILAKAISTGLACSMLSLAAAHADESASAAEESAGVTFSAAYTGEAWTVASGGLEDGGAYLDNLDLQLTVDLEKTFGWSGAQFFFYGLYNNGNTFAGEKVGDLNGVSNIETGVEALRVEEVWIDQTFASGNASLRVGIYDLNSEFDAGEVRGLFILSSHGIGTEYAQAGDNGPSIFPITGLAGRLNYNFDGGFYARVAVLDGVPGDVDHPKRTTIDLNSDDGALIAGEIGLTNDEGRIWSLGAWHFTKDFPDLTTAETHNSNSGVYIALEEPLLSRKNGSDFDLGGFVRFGVADDDINPLSSYFGAGLAATGIFASRPDDKLGFAVAVANVGDKYKSIISGDGGDPTGSEINLELTYAADVTDWLSLQPDLQYIIHPNADESVEDTFVAGLRFTLHKDWELR